MVSVVNLFICWVFGATLAVLRLIPDSMLRGSLLEVLWGYI